ncbi:MAG: hypothetical protein J7J33_01555 [Caldisericia bacterium]|nr:hypothetical protein [Caldisericia bacterium]
MISFLKGKVIAREENSIVILTPSGIGFKVFVPYPEKIKDEIFVSHVSDSREQNLFGFLTFEELTLFEKLIKLPGIGPKSILSLFRYYTPSELYKAIENKEDLIVKGVRKKILKDIVNFLSKDIEESYLKEDEFSEAVKVLLSLGFEKDKVYDIVRKVRRKKGKELKVDEIVKLALKEIKNEGK